MSAMRLFQGLRKFTTTAVQLAGVLLEEKFEQWASPEALTSREELIRLERESRERAAELALEVARLEDKVDSLRFNGPSLWKDEVEALQEMIFLRADVAGTLASLLDRCDHMPTTAAEMGRMAQDAIDEIKGRPWGPPKGFFEDDPITSDDPGKDIDDEDIPF